MDKSFFTYKGFPLVRHEDVIYYGNMSDDYVVMLKILNKKKVHDIDVASKIKVFICSLPCRRLPPRKVIITAAKKVSVRGFDSPNGWASRTPNNKKGPLKLPTFEKVSKKLYAEFY